MHAPPRTAAPDAIAPIPADVLLLAYRSGIFPMADHRDDPDVYWVEPRERAIIPLDGFHLSRSLRKTLRQDRFRVSCDEAFGAVIAACAAPREEHAESWISHRIEASYLALHAEGLAHSVECWMAGDDGREVLAGGLYGVAFDRVFCGESMFSRADDASKVALAGLVAAMRQAGYALLDCQFITGHLTSMGAAPIPQADYVRRLETARGAPVQTLPQAFGEFSAAGGSSASSPGKRIAQSLTQTS